MAAKPLWKGGDAVTTFEAFSLIAQFGLLLIAAFTLIVTIVVYLTKKK